MDTRITITIPKSSRNTTIGKLLVILISGCFFGYWFSLDAKADLKKAQTLTLQEYRADFDRYKADLLTPGDIPVAGGIFAMLLVLSILFGLYELLGCLMGLIIGKIFNSRENRDNLSNPLE
jgi:hypothetical protein